MYEYNIDLIDDVKDDDSKSSTDGESQTAEIGLIAGDINVNVKVKIDYENYYYQNIVYIDLSLSSPKKRRRKKQPRKKRRNLKMTMVSNLFI